MNGRKSPGGDIHPGEIVFDDHVDGTQWTEPASKVPVTIAWYEDEEDHWLPVVRIEISGSEEQRRITRFGPDNNFFDTTIEAPPPMPTPQRRPPAKTTARTPRKKPD